MNRNDNHHIRAANSQISSAIPPTGQREQYASSPKVPRSSSVVSQAGFASNRVSHQNAAPMSQHVDTWLQVYSNLINRHLLKNNLNKSQRNSMSEMLKFTCQGPCQLMSQHRSVHQHSFLKKFKIKSCFLPLCARLQH
jgi:hypothetical protein